MTNDIWASVQACVPGVYGYAADSIYRQIDCHVKGTRYGYWWAGGYSWEFETWRPIVSWDVMVATQCNPGGNPYAPL